MNKTIIYSLTIFAGIILAITINMKQDFGEEKPSNVNQPINIDDKIPPQLSDLFEGQEDGPHQKYVDEKSCLICHKQEMDIPKLGKVPKIPHEFQPDCVSCHFLPSA